MLTSYNWTAC